ncbi:MAG: hypothetical protein AAFX09_12745 [Pseudomonadota bacterium]
MRVVLLACVGLLAGLITGKVEAGAWVREPGETLVIRTVMYDELRLPGGDVLRKDEIAIYAEHGFSERLTLVGRIALQDITRFPESSSDEGFALRNLSGSELAARWSLYDYGRWAVSAQALITLQGPGENWNNAPFGQGGGDVEARVLAGRSIGESHFIEGQLAYRRRTDAVGDEVRFDVTVGLQLIEDFMLLGRSHVIWSPGPEGEKPFANHRVQASIRYDVSARTSLEFGALGTVSASRMAEERALMVSLWRRF